MRKRVITVAVAAVMVLTASVALAAHRFTDVPDSNTFHNDIAWLADMEITRGCNPPANTQFCPDDPVTRGQMAAFLRRFHDTITEPVPGPQGPAGPQGPVGPTGPAGPAGPAAELDNFYHTSTPGGPFAEGQEFSFTHSCDPSDKVTGSGFQASSGGDPVVIHVSESYPEASAIWRLSGVATEDGTTVILHLSCVGNLPFGG